MKIHILLIISVLILSGCTTVTEETPDNTGDIGLVDNSGNDISSDIDELNNIDEDLEELENLDIGDLS